MQRSERNTMTQPISDTLYFIGIGGVGMSGIARVAHNQGLNVSGSDLKSSRFTKQLEEAGIKVLYGQDASNLPDGNPTVVVSTAILDDNPEYVEAKARGLNIVHRAQMLAHLGRNLETLAVAGTHGKTTTSSMLASVLAEMGESPTFLVGGIVREYASNAHSGDGRYYVVEADESDKSFTHLSPSAMIVTNVEPDHLDHYKDLNEIYNVFSRFISLLPEGAPCVVCNEDAMLVKIARESADNVITYGFDDDSDVRITRIEPRGVSTDFSIRFKDGRTFDSTIKQNPGVHNVLNGSAVLALIDALGLDAAKAADALKDFTGVRRRFDLVGEAAGVTVIDDYAHHPTEIAATIKAAKTLDFKRVHVVFQPHRYSRAALFTDILKDEFGSAFDEADTITFMDVYPAGETPIPGINGKTFLNVVLDHEGHPEAFYIPRRVDVAPQIADMVDPGDMVITMGAGDVTEIGRLIIDDLQEKKVMGAFAADAADASSTTSSSSDPSNEA